MVTFENKNFLNRKNIHLLHDLDVSDNKLTDECLELTSNNTYV